MVISIQLAVTCSQVTRSASAALGRIAPTLMSSGTTTPVTAFTLRTDSTRPSSISTTLRSMRLAIIFTLARLAFILRRRLFFYHQLPFLINMEHGLLIWILGSLCRPVCPSSSCACWSSPCWYYPCYRHSCCSFGHQDTYQGPC